MTDVLNTHRTRYSHTPATLARRIAASSSFSFFIFFGCTLGAAPTPFLINFSIWPMSRADEIPQMTNSGRADESDAVRAAKTIKRNKESRIIDRKKTLLLLLLRNDFSHFRASRDVNHLQPMSSVSLNLQ
jgi:hypothetical protein